MPPETSRPRVTLKIATSLDGRIGTSSGESQWITGPEARMQGHRLRAEHDAVLVGVETVLADDPRLTVRLSPSAHPGESRDPALSRGTASAPDLAAASMADRPKDWVPAFAGMSGEEKQPLRVVLDSRLRTPPFARLATAGTLILTTRDPVAVGTAEVVRVAGDSHGRPTVAAVLDLLAARGMKSLMIEGGGRVAACFVAAGVVDGIEWFRAPILLGGDGRPGVAALALARLANAPRYRRLAVEPLGDDLWERYERLS